MNVSGVGRSHGFDHVDDNEGVDKAQEAEAPALPRSSWDKEALGKAVEKTLSKVAADASRPNHRTKWVDAKRTSGAGEVAKHVSVALGKSSHAAHAKPPSTKPDKPVIAMKYGVPVNHGGNTKPDKPVIVAKYGVPIHNGGGTNPDKPVIVAKYGVPMPHPGGNTNPDKPVIVAKYGVPINHGGGSQPDHPVIAMKYGVPIRHK